MPRQFSVHGTETSSSSAKSSSSLWNSLCISLETARRLLFAKFKGHGSVCTIRFLHAPPCDYDLQSPIRVGEHTDFGAYTFVLYPPGARADGLQIKSVQGAEVGGTSGGEEDGWQTVVLPNNSKVVGAVVNTGAIMARWTNDEWRATAHRVVVPSAELANQERFSVALFVDPDCNSIVKVHEQVCRNGKECKYEPVSSIDYLLGKLKAVMNQ